MSLKKQVLRLFELRIEEVLLFVIIILTLLDFLELLSPEWDYIKKIISWAGLAYLFYCAHPSKLFSGEKNNITDVLLILGFFSFTIKNFIEYSFVMLDSSSSFLLPLFEYVASHPGELTSYGIYFGLFFILIAGLRLTIFTPKKPSVISYIWPSHIAKEFSLKELGFRFITYLGIMFLFFFIIFNLAVEWLAVAIDAPLVLIGVLFYFALVLRHKKEAFKEKTLVKISSFGEELYERILTGIVTLKGSLRAITAVLILHMITDLFIYFMPILLGLKNILYHEVVAHQTLWSFLVKDLAIYSGLSSIGVVIIYALSIFSAISLLLLPFILWWVSFKEKRFVIYSWFGLVILTGFLVLLLNRVIMIRPILHSSLVRVSIFINQISNSLMFFLSLGIIFLFVFSSLLLSTTLRKKLVHHSTIILTQSFFVVYIFLYAFSLVVFYVHNGLLILQNNDFFIILFMFLHVVSMLFLYVFGTYYFIYHTKHHNKKLLME